MLEVYNRFHSYDLFMITSLHKHMGNTTNAEKKTTTILFRINMNWNWVR